MNGFFDICRFETCTSPARRPSAHKRQCVRKLKNNEPKREALRWDTQQTNLILWKFARRLSKPVACLQKECSRKYSGKCNFRIFFATEFDSQAAPDSHDLPRSAPRAKVRSDPRWMWLHSIRRDPRPTFDYDVPLFSTHTIEGPSKNTQTL